MNSKQGRRTVGTVGRMGVGIAMLGVLAAGPRPALAADKVEDYRIRFEQVLPGVDNPCTPQLDDIVLNVSGEIVGKRWLDQDGSWRAQSAVHIRQSGYAADGTHYTGGNQFRADTRYDAGLVHIVADTRQRLTSAGATDNFVSRFKVLASFDVSGTSSTFEIVKDVNECRG